MGMYDATAAGALAAIASVYDATATGALTKINTVYDATAAGALTLVHQDAPPEPVVLVNGSTNNLGDDSSFIFAPGVGACLLFGTLGMYEYYWYISGIPSQYLPYRYLHIKAYTTNNEEIFMGNRENTSYNFTWQGPNVVEQVLDLAQAVDSSGVIYIMANNAAGDFYITEMTNEFNP